eukprot:CAMPEP_0118692252 /NCGR_PEP_ID=MMETSP0800-20121206/11163_1 /TAXON_ID=210618 ORGANISM="Striatella unipunctata, Strain CCMP2910" /NCGR_SAMPLE_ID=MMETSP0800 /ASSEMBLY_ACC=CAM_ASM_000638 /LENGTH=106 /DNA_ID=CAMNT_0006590183 /DNA_START=18 /DNA_END=338 /DNA_ORIENTATION=+
MSANAPMNEWLKPPSNLPPLVEVDPAQIVEPPPGMEIGYVPIVVYQGMSRPSSCEFAPTLSPGGTSCGDVSGYRYWGLGCDFLPAVRCLLFEDVRQNCRQTCGLCE